MNTKAYLNGLMPPGGPLASKCTAVGQGLAVGRCAARAGYRVVVVYLNQNLHVLADCDVGVWVWSWRMIGPELSTEPHTGGQQKYIERRKNESKVLRLFQYSCSCGAVAQAAQGGGGWGRGCSPDTSLQ